MCVYQCVVTWELQLQYLHTEDPSNCQQTARHRYRSWAARLKSTSRCLIVSCGWNYSFIHAQRESYSINCKKTVSRSSGEKAIILLNVSGCLQSFVGFLCFFIRSWRHNSREEGCDGLWKGQRRHGHVYSMNRSFFKYLFKNVMFFLVKSLTIELQNQGNTFIFMYIIYTIYYNNPPTPLSNEHIQ